MKKMAMPSIRRFYDAVLREHQGRHRQMGFVTGPRQVGKTTTCRARTSAYLNWDNQDDRQLLLAGPAAVAERIGLAELRAEALTCTVTAAGGPCSRVYSTPTATACVRSSRAAPIWTSSDGAARASWAATFTTACTR